MGLGAPLWRVILTGLNVTAMLTVATVEALTDLDIPAGIWVLWVGAAVAWLAYSAHLTAKDNARRAAIADKMIADLVERARRNGAGK